MQTTKALILQYGRTHRGDKDAARLRKRIRTRAKGGDKMAKNFISTHFSRGSIHQIEKQLSAWLVEWESNHGPAGT